MHTKTIIRVVYSVALFVSAQFFPWFVAAAIGLVGFFAFERYYEGVAAGVYLDLLFGTGGKAAFGIPALFTAGAAIAYAIQYYVRKHVRRL